MLPKVKIEGVELTENDYINDGQAWNALKLIEHSKQFTVFDLPLIGINLNSNVWGETLDIDAFIYHAQRIEKTDLKHPILLDHKGVICDGWHRVCKAILKGKKTIKAIRLETMPPCDKIIEE